MVIEYVQNVPKYCKVSNNQISIATCKQILYLKQMCAVYGARFLRLFAIQLINVDDIIMDVISRELSKFAIARQTGTALEDCNDKKKCLFVII